MKLGIIGAMENEIALLREQMTIDCISRHAAMDFVDGSLCGVNATLVRCSYGKVNAALCTQLLVSLYHVTHVIFTGVAGSLDPAINICDIVISTDAVQHDVDVTATGHAPGQIPDLETRFVADAALRATVRKAIATHAPEVQVFEGTVATGDQFVSDIHTKQRIVETFGALCCEMEGGAVAQCCQQNNIPFVIVRAISDKADGSAEMDHHHFEDEAAERSARIVVEAATLLAG